MLANYFFFLIINDYKKLFTVIVSRKHLWQVW